MGTSAFFMRLPGNVLFTTMTNTKDNNANDHKIKKIKNKNIKN